MASSQATKIGLRYHGPEVDGSTMPVGLVVEALEGFSGAYRKAAGYIAPDLFPELRVSVPERGSFHLLVLAAVALAQNPAQLATSFVDFWEHAERIAHLLAEVINIKKHTKAQPYNIRIEGEHNQVFIVNADKLELQVTPQALDVFEKKFIDRDLDKIVDPVRPGRIDTAELAIDDKVEAVVTSKERPYFRPEAAQTTAKADELVGNLVSLNKERGGGTFRMEGDKSVPYHFVGENDDKFRQDFSYKGPVRVSGTVQYDDNGNPKHVAITDVERLQGEFPFPPANKVNG